MPTQYRFICNGGITARRASHTKMPVETRTIGSPPALGACTSIQSISLLCDNVPLEDQDRRSHSRRMTSLVACCSCSEATAVLMASAPRIITTEPPTTNSRRSRPAPASSPKTSAPM